MRGTGMFGVQRASAVCSIAPVAMPWSWHTTRLWPRLRAEAVAMAARTAPTGHSKPLATGIEGSAYVATMVGIAPCELLDAQPSRPQRHGTPGAMVERPQQCASVVKPEAAIGLIANLQANPAA